MNDPYASPSPSPGTVFDGSLRRGDRLVRFAPYEGILHSAVVVSERIESAASLLRRGVPVEAAGPGGYVEVAEMPPDGGDQRLVGRLLTDAWGRLARGQTIVRARARTDININATPGAPITSTSTTSPIANTPNNYTTKPAGAPVVEPEPEPAPAFAPAPALAPVLAPALEPIPEPATEPAIDEPLAEAPTPTAGTTIVRRRVPQGFFARKFDEFANDRQQPLVSVRIHNNIVNLTFARDLADLHGLKPVSLSLGHLEAELPWLPNPNITIKDLNSDRVVAGATRVADAKSPGGRAMALVLEVQFETKGTELALNNFGDIDLQQLNIHVELVLVRTIVDGRGAIGFRPAVRVDVKATLNWGPDGIARRKVKSTIERKLVAGLLNAQFQQRAARALTRWLVGGPWEVRSLELVGDELVVGYVEPPRHELVQIFAEQPQKPLTVGALAKVDHIVVLMMENRSFDHMLGYLSLAGGRKDVDGLTGKEINRYKGRDWRPFHLTDTVFDHDPCHDRDCVQTQVAGGMGGFVANFASGLRSGRISPGDIMGYYDAKDLPVYDVLAREFAICDRWFAAHPGPTFPNRFYTLTGRLARDQFGNTVYRNPDLVTYAPTQSKSIFDHLSQRAVSWRYYEHGYGFLRLFHRWVTDIEAIRPAADFFAAAAAGTLPSVAYIDPDFIEYPPANDDHAPANVRDGQRLIARIVNALMKGPAWSRTLLLVTYDEHGGFYDHVTPPGAVDVSGVNEYGVRVPAFAVSPWIERGTVSHTVFDHTSILKTIVRRFCAANPPDLGARVAAAADLGSLLTRTKPRTDLPLLAVPAASPTAPAKVAGEQDIADARGAVSQAASLRDFHALLAVTRARYPAAAGKATGSPVTARL
ncbi:alkaline phosphatase family protein [Brevundimonas sp.]|uniref:alkaline phosphatase family protein n=1 Tax=Brevundimonas sp. TaxID=1871086 RepID=UPI002731C67D|nr:alkaline phosphatase family protein [Brevundimonas sp.]MDP1913220.1 alkaline phosphatase family protein [Brevundimonas sp.]